ncbi:MAG: LysR family transcriptional regulator [Acidimicrobiales bacterium]
MPLSPSFPDLASLDLYASVVELGSLGRAAKAHGITQPSASSRIKTLERQLDILLLERSPTGSTPTSAGVVVAGWADSILTAARALETGTQALKAEQVGRLRIAASYTIAEYLLPRWLGSFLGDHPGDRIALDVANSTAVLHRLERGQADLGFIETPLDTPTMAERVVAHDQLVAVVPPTHDWCRRRTVTLEQLAATPLVTREEGSGTREALEAALREADLPMPPSVLELGSTAAVRSAVVSGNAPTVISRLAVIGEIDRGQLVEISVKDLHIERRLRAVWPATKPLPRLAEDLLKSL